MSQLVEIVKEIANNAKLILWRSLTAEEKRNKCNCKPINKKCICEHYYYQCIVTPYMSCNGKLFHMLSFYTCDDKRHTDYLINLTSRKVSPSSIIKIALTSSIIDKINVILGASNKISHDQTMSLHHFNNG